MVKNKRSQMRKRVYKATTRVDLVSNWQKQLKEIGFVKISIGDKNDKDMFWRVREQLKSVTKRWELIEGGGLRYQTFLCNKQKSKDSKVKTFIAK
jgi:hypothetical protein